MENLRKYGSRRLSVAVIHGGPGAPGEMAPVARELSQLWGVLEPLQTEASLEGQVGELKGVIERYADLPVTLVGFSWGAMLSFICGALHPSLVKKLILVGSPPFEEKYATRILETRLGILKDFRLFLLPHCGHVPWRERRARDPFYDILKRELR
ncbi:MAG: alpha/beta hydrolase [Dehalococcoidia bacterium]|nr:alpha/beta hydrolase [Dehalococcoidia bacterium]